MLYSDRIDISEGTDPNQTSASKECGFFTISIFQIIVSSFNQNVCNRCHDLLMMSMNLSGIAILNLRFLIIAILLV